MNRDLRAAIMRSNSFQFGSVIPKIQPVKMRAKDDSHKIITNHEPLNEETYPATANSVLDALEKNCRKRINNEELILDRSKKFCSPTYEQQQQQPPQINIQQAPQSVKRTREPPSPNKKSSFDLQQRAKKLRTRNNALLCSLSSSHHELIPTTPPSSPQILNKTKPIPNSIFNKSPVVVVEKGESEKEKSPTEEKKSVETEVIDAPQEKSKKEDDAPRKLQLFNRKPDQNAVSNRAKFRLYDSDDEEEEVHIKFIKPKAQVIEGNDDRKEIEKAKLSRMLDSLTKGTETPFKPKENAKDTVDSVKPKDPPKTTQAASISFSTSTTTAIVAPLTSSGSTSVTSSILKDVQTSTSGGFQLSTGISLNKPDEKNDTKRTELPSIQLPVATSIPSIVSTVSKEGDKAPTESALTVSGGIKFSFGNTQKTQESEKPSFPATTSSEKPSLGGFQFGSIATTPSSQLSNSLSASTSLSQPVSKAVSPLALFSTSVIPQTSQSIGIASKIETVTTTASGIGFSFGGETKSTISGITPIPSSVSTTTPSISFNFGAKPAEVTTAPSSFNFGSNTSIITTTAQQQIVQPLESKPSFSFGGSAKPEAPKSTFSFGNTAQAASSTPVATPIFGQLSSSNSSVAVTTASSGFNFGSNTSVTSANTLNTFGQLSSTPSFTSLNKVVPSTEPPSFGTLSTPVTTTSGSIFGSVTTNSQQKASVFGGFNANSNTPASGSSQTTFGQSSEAPKSTFSFGQSNSSSAVPVVSSSSIFGSSQAPAKPSFNFGGGLSTQRSFGGISSAPSQETKPAFNFTSSSNAPAFGLQTSTAAASAPVFGSSTPFGSSSQESQKPAFNFNNPSSSFNFNNKPQETPSPFGSVQSQQSSADKPGFNFGQALPQLPQVSPAFNIGTAGQQQQQRKPFRTATRRLK